VAFEDGRLTGGFTTESKPGGAPLVVLYAGKLEEIFASVKAQRGRIVREIFSFPGGRRFHFVDPNGNELAVWGAPHEIAASA
jgi:predicted enzyme related to lactoylglutathione lyase